jgi:hypothetical protein
MLIDRVSALSMIMVPWIGCPTQLITSTFFLFASFF